MNKQYLIDNHTHLNMEPLYSEWEKLVEICKQKKMFLNLASSTPLDVQRAIEISKKGKISKVLMAIHPTDVDKFEIKNIEKQFDEFYEKNKDIIIGIGEAGLDKKHPDIFPSFQNQIKWLKWHAQYANKLNLPIMLHVRMAYRELLDLWDEFNFKTQVIIHCFTGTYEEVKELLQKGCYISFSGLVTHKKLIEEQGIIESIKAVSLDKIFIETDAPFLTPKKYRSKTNINMPFYIDETYEFIANVKNISVEELIKNVNINYKKAYNLEDFGY